MSEELKVTKEKVLEAAAKCKDAERVLKTIFPEAFVKPKPVLVFTLDGVRDEKGNMVIYHDALSNSRPGNVLHLESGFRWSIRQASVGPGQELVCERE